MHPKTDIIYALSRLESLESKTFLHPGRIRCRGGFGYFLTSLRCRETRRGGPGPWMGGGGSEGGGGSDRGSDGGSGRKEKDG